MPKPKLIKSKEYKGQAINVNLKKGQYCYLDIIDNTNEQLCAMLERYNPVFILRFDLHSYSPSNISISRFFKNLKESLCTKTKIDSPYKNHKVIAYQWVKEVERSKRAHYHCWVAVAGRRISRPGLIGSITGSSTHSRGLLGEIEYHWKRVDPGGNVGAIPMHFGHTIRRGEPTSMGDCIYHLSYLAKSRGKQYGKGTLEKNHGCSRLKRNPAIPFLKRA